MATAVVETQLGGVVLDDVILDAFELCAMELPELAVPCSVGDVTTVPQFSVCRVRASTIVQASP